jgi:hypothetical protein
MNSADADAAAAIKSRYLCATSSENIVLYLCLNTSNQCGDIETIHYAYAYEYEI